MFVLVILGATQDGAPTAMAGLIIGLTLVLIHLAGITVSGSSVNPARSIGPALIQGGEAINQLWLFIRATSFFLSATLFFAALPHSRSRAWMRARWLSVGPNGSHPAETYHLATAALVCPS